MGSQNDASHPGVSQISQRNQGKELQTLTAAFAQAPVAFALTMGPEHIFQKANGRYMDLINNREIVGKSVKMALPEIESQGFLELLDQVYKTGERFEGKEVRARLDRGDQKGLQDYFLNFTYEPFRDDSGTVVGIIVVVNDVTEQVIARNKIRESAEELKVLTEFTPQMLFTAAANGDITYFNQQWTDYTGLTFEETKNWGWKPVLHPNHYESTVQRWRYSLETGEPYEIQYLLKRKDGSYRWHLGRALPVRGPDQKILKWVGTNIDIHEQKSINEKLLELRNLAESEKQKFETIFADASTAMAVTVGPDHVYEKTNPSYLKLFDGREFIGKPLLEAIPELKGQPFPDLFDKVYQTGEAYYEREAFAQLRRTPNGPLEARFFDQSYTQMRDAAGKPYGVFIHAIDVTERVLASRALKLSEGRLIDALADLQMAKEAADKANQAKTTFLANMSHEIRTPLGAIMGFVNLLKEAESSAEEVQHFLSVIDRNSKQLLNLVDDILDLSKVEAGKVVIEAIEFSLMELLADFSTMMSLKAQEKGITFQMVIRQPLPEMILSDPTRVKQILINIVGNAVKFTDVGSVTLTVSCSQQTLEFKVEDTGRGISKDQAELLFQPFSQGDKSITRKYGGTGLGLVLTRKLAETMKGSFELTQSELGKGSTFTARIQVELPSHTVKTTVAGKEMAKPSATPGILAGMNILVVEDSADNRSLMAFILGRTQARFDFANNGEEGVRKALAQNYDVVLMDVQMPVKDGVTAVKELRAQGYKTAIVALTAHAMKEERERCLNAGFTDFLSKPIRQDDLLSKIRQFKN